MIHDEFYWISQINKASVVSNSREKLLDEATAKLAARGIAAVEKEADVDASKRVKKYIAYEPMVIAGPRSDDSARGPFKSGHSLDDASGYSARADV